MKGYTITNMTIMIDCNVRIEQAVVANLGILADNYVRINLASVANNNIIANICECSNIYIFTYLSRRRNESQRINTCFLRLHRFVELQKFSHAFVCVVYLNKGSLGRLFEFYTLVYEHDA